MKRSPIRQVSKKMAKQKRAEHKLIELLMIRCNGFCEKCGGAPDWRGLSIHHIVPKKMGGTSHAYTADELMLVCGECHSEFHGVIEK